MANEQLFGLTQDQAKRIGKLVQGNERQPPSQLRQQSGTSPPDQTFWAELTDEDPTQPGNYKWKMVQIDDRTFIDADPAVDSGSDYSAVEPNRLPCLVKCKVPLTFYGYNDAGRPRYLIGMIPSQSVGVSIQGIESNAPGMYKGSIFGGLSTADNSDQLVMPEGLTGGTLSTVNNALVLNLAENRMNSHLLTSADMTNAQNGRWHVGHIVGLTSETTPRWIVAIRAWQMTPVIVQITSAGGFGYYTGKVLEGTGVVQSGHDFDYFRTPASANANILNLWEKFIANSNASRLVADGSLYVPGTLIGSFLTGSPQAYWLQVHICIPVAGTSPGTAPIITTTQTADNSYDANEAGMLNALKTDVTATNTFLTALYTNLKNAGYVK